MRRGRGYQRSGYRQRTQGRRGDGASIGGFLLLGILGYAAYSVWLRTPHYVRLTNEALLAVEGGLAALALLVGLVLFSRWLGRRSRNKEYFQAIAEFRWRKGMSPTEFETCCSDYLLTRGWRSETTKGSGDFGIDVLARKRGRSLVVQCKLLSKPVGIKAVQEAHAGRGYANADIAAVVSNRGYTRQARELAERTGVLLLHFTDLRNIDSLCAR